jgi:hypothetical protein
MALAQSEPRRGRGPRPGVASSGGCLMANLSYLDTD